MGACSIATQWREVLGLLKDAASLTVGLGQVLCDNRVVFQQVRKAQLFSTWMIRQQHSRTRTCNFLRMGSRRKYDMPPAYRKSHSTWMNDIV